MVRRGAVGGCWRTELLRASSLFHYLVSLYCSTILFYLLFLSAYSSRTVRYLGVRRVWGRRGKPSSVVGLCFTYPNPNPNPSSGPHQELPRATLYIFSSVHVMYHGTRSNGVAFESRSPRFPNERLTTQDLVAGVYGTVAMSSTLAKPRGEWATIPVPILPRYVSSRVLFAVLPGTTPLSTVTPSRRECRQRNGMPSRSNQKTISIRDAHALRCENSPLPLSVRSYFVCNSLKLCSPAM